MCRRGAKKNGGQEAQALGRSRGGFSTKLHIAVDAWGNGLRFILTSGSTNDITQATALIKDFDVDYVIADKGYDSDDFVIEIAAAASSSGHPTAIASAEAA